MHRIGKTFVRLSADNRLRIDRLRRHDSTTRDRVVNQIVRDYFDAQHETAEPRPQKRRAA